MKGEIILSLCGFVYDSKRAGGEHWPYQWFLRGRFCIYDKITDFRVVPKDLSSVNEDKRLGKTASLSVRTPPLVGPRPPLQSMGPKDSRDARLLAGLLR